MPEKEPLTLVGIAEIAEMLMRITHRGINTLTFRDDFPPPLAELISGEVWNHDDVTNWIAAHPEAVAEIFRPAAHLSLTA
jgi:hypothetical protein